MTSPPLLQAQNTHTHIWDLCHSTNDTTQVILDLCHSTNDSTQVILDLCHSTNDSTVLWDGRVLTECACSGPYSPSPTWPSPRSSHSGCAPGQCGRSWGASDCDPASLLLGRWHRQIFKTPLIAACINKANAIEIKGTCKV